MILGNWEFTLASLLLQLNRLFPGRCSPSCLSVCIWYHRLCDLGILINWSFLRPAESCALEGYPSATVVLTFSNFWQSQSSGGMATDIRTGFLGCLPLHGLLDLSGSGKSLSNTGMKSQPINECTEPDRLTKSHIFGLLLSF